MSTTTLQTITLTVGLCLIGCSAAEGESIPIGGSGGSVTASGGASGGQTPATGGQAAQTGGTTQSGGVATTGGFPSSGGMTGGSPTGGTTATSGGNSSGGRAGGGSNATGGGKTDSSGGTSTGGKASGGSAGSKATGGSAGAGGSKATGGTSSTGGVSSTGGTTGAPKKFCGNITTSNSVDTGGMKFSKYWDQITPENAGKWGSVQSSASGAFNWTTLDAIYSYAQTNGILFKQHTFVWGSQQPSGTPTQAQVETWIKSFCQRYPNTALIDVVNEPPPHTTPNYTANLGAGETGTYGWITKAFQLARQYCGSAILILNDYNNIEYTDQENHFIDIATQVKAAGAPIDAVGVQAHAAHSLSATALQNNLNTMATKTGLPIYVTEYDVPEASDATQLSVFQTQFPIFWNTASVHGVTIWGWINGKTWVANTGLVNGTTPRSSMTWLMQQLGRPNPPN